MSSARFDRTELQNELNIMQSGYDDDEFCLVDRSFESNFLKKKNIRFGSPLKNRIDSIEFDSVRKVR